MNLGKIDSLDGGSNWVGENQEQGRIRAAEGCDAAESERKEGFMDSSNFRFKRRAKQTTILLPFLDLGSAVEKGKRPSAFTAAFQEAVLGLGRRHSSSVAPTVILGGSSTTPAAGKPHEKRKNNGDMKMVGNFES